MPGAFVFVCKSQQLKKKKPLNKQVKKTNKKATTLNIYCNYTGNVLFINTGIGKNQKKIKKVHIALSPSLKPRFKFGTMVLLGSCVFLYICFHL